MRKYIRDLTLVDTADDYFQAKTMRPIGALVPDDAILVFYDESPPRSEDLIAISASRRTAISDLETPVLWISTPHARIDTKGADAPRMSATKTASRKVTTIPSFLDEIDVICD